MKSFVALGLLLSAMLATPALSAVVYNTDTTAYNLSITAASAEQVGDRVTLAGTERYVTSVVVPFTYAGASAFNADLTVTLYDNDGALTTDGIAPDGNLKPSTVIDSSSLTNEAFNPSQSRTLTFNFNFALVPNSFTFAVALDNLNDPGATGVELLISHAVLVGSSPDLIWYYGAGDWFDDETQSGTDDQVRATINAVQVIPEPASFVLLAVGTLLMVRRRRGA